MNRTWSRYVQTSEELYRTRALRFHDGNRALWLEALGIVNSMNVLEVGCGGGIFCHRIKTYLPAAQVTGIDIDAGHIAYAEKKSAKLGLNCHWVNGNALTRSEYNRLTHLINERFDHRVHQYLSGEKVWDIETSNILAVSGRKV